MTPTEFLTSFVAARHRIFDRHAGLSHRQKRKAHGAGARTAKVRRAYQLAALQNRISVLEIWPVARLGKIPAAVELVRQGVIELYIGDPIGGVTATPLIDRAQLTRVINGKLKPADVDWQKGS